ncbi:MAG: hypothetical protein ACRCZJ_08880 [Erysipelotrichaceae bacterium]
MEVKELVALQRRYAEGTFKECKEYQQLLAWLSRLDQKHLESQTCKDGFALLLSRANFEQRKQMESCDETGVWVKEGDICFIDFGEAYINEVGFLHFGLVMKIRHRKALVLPLTSKGGKRKPHLMSIGTLPNLYKESFVLLNDAKFINSARIIDVKSNISPNSTLFQAIQEKFMHYITT